MGTLRTAAMIMAMVVSATAAIPASAQKHPPRRPSTMPTPRPPVPRGNDLLLGSAVNGGVFAITAANAPVAVLPRRAPQPSRRPRSEHPRGDVIAHR